jgi:glycosyltransferase involved in cell wall biosynthesis
MNLSVVIPVKDERDNLRPLHERLRGAVDPLDIEYELIFVDDGSGDDSAAILEELAAVDPRVKVVRLRRNYGQSAALQAGIDWSKGDVLVTLDGDLQNDPADIPLLLEHMAQGYDAVFGRRAKRQDSWMIRKLPSQAGNWLIRWVTGSAVRDMGCTLRALRRDLAEDLALYGEMHRFVPVLAQQFGARMIQVDVQHHPRTAGKTKYTLSRTFRVILDLITVKFMASYLTRPMHVMGGAGLVAMGSGGVVLFVTLLLKFFADLHLNRSPLPLLSVMLELIGVQFISMGLLGEVLARTYFESQGKSPYAVRSTCNLEPPLRKHVA